MAIPEIAATWQEVKEENMCFGVVTWNQNPQMKERFTDRLKSMLFRKLVRASQNLVPRVPRSKPEVPAVSRSEQAAKSDCDVGVALFCSEKTSGVVDLGASQTVIGDSQIKSLLQNLPDNVKNQVRREKINLTFRFGNHATLRSKWALHFPLQGSSFRVAIVPGNTPFLISSTFLKRTLKAVIDVDEGTVRSKSLNRFVPVSITEKNLMLMDINDLWKDETQQIQASKTAQVKPLEVICTAETLPESKPSSDVRLSAKEFQVDENDSLKEFQKSVVPPSGPRVRAEKSLSDPNSLDSIHVASGETQGIYQGKIDAVLNVPFEEMTMEQLSQSKVEFGKSKLNQTFAEAFQDQQWTMFIVKNYEKSSKPEHRKFLHYVDMMVKGPDPVGRKTCVKSKSKPPTSASASTKPAPDVQEFEEMSEPWEIPDAEMIASLHGHQVELFQRMYTIENTLKQVVDHLQALTLQTVKTEEEP